MIIQRRDSTRISSQPNKFFSTIFVKGAQNLQISFRIFLKISETLKIHITDTEADFNKR